MPRPPPSPPFHLSLQRRRPLAFTMPTAIEYKDVCFSYGPSSEPVGGAAPGASGAGGGRSRLVLDRVSLGVEEGHCLGILGPNGGGKSTLLKLTLGLLRPQSGEIRVLGMAPEAARRRRIVGYVPQRLEAELAFPLSVRQVVSMSATIGLSPWRSMSAEAKAAVEEAIAAVGAGAIADKPIGELSGGQVQRAMIARALACRPRVLILDEPTVGIDPAGQQQFARMLHELRAGRPLTIVVVSHDIRTVAAGCDRIACLARTLHSHVTPQGLTPAALAEVFRHDVAAIFGDVHVDAHAAAACSDPTHAHIHGPAAAPSPTLTISAKGPPPREDVR